MAIKLFVIGSNGMLGHQVAKAFREHPGYNVTCMSARTETLAGLMDIFTPHVVINCAGIVPKNPDAADVVKLFDVNSVLPHRLHAECVRHNARLIHISTDCVFSGNDTADYTELDEPAPVDNYGWSKLAGEVVDSTNALTIRTSLIGPELGGNKRGLLEWFLSPESTPFCTGYANAFFSGLTTNEFAKVLRDHIVPNPMLHGVLHVAGPAISKLELLQRIATEYNLPIAISQAEEPHIDRCLDSRVFRTLTGYKPPTWREMIREMHRASK